MADEPNTAFISSPPSRFPSAQPEKIMCMTNHNEESYNDGYNSNDKLLYFDAITAGGEDPSSYLEKSINITTPPKNPPSIPPASADAPPNAQPSMSFSTGSALFGRKPGIWGLLSLPMNKPVQ